jgi:hypothetical protein
VNAAGHTFRGGGGFGSDVIVLSNDGLIQADTAVPLTVDLNAGATNDNTGTMQAAGGATLRIVNSVIDNTGGLIRAFDASVVEVQNSTIQHGDLDTDGSGEFRLNHNAVLDDVVSAADMVCPNNTDNYLRNTNTNNGTISMEATVNYTQVHVGTPSATLAGSGTLSMGDTGYNRVSGTASGYRLVNGTGHTIRGAGNLGTNVIDITNQGSIIADLSTGMVIEPNTEMHNQGTLQVTGAGAATINPGTFSNSGQVTIDATRTLTRHQNYVQTAGETLVNGTLAMASSGSLQLQGGTLKGSGNISGDVSSTAAVAPGQSIGRLSITGNYTQTVGGSLRIEIGGASPGEFDTLAISGAATLDGALEIVPVGAYAPGPGQAFTILTAASRTGAFALANCLGQYSVTYTPIAVIVTTAAACPGDITCDRQVDVDDLIAVITAWGPCPQPCPPACRADVDQTCGVDVDDLITVIVRWGPCT